MARSLIRVAVTLAVGVGLGVGTGTVAQAAPVHPVARKAPPRMDPYTAALKRRDQARLAADVKTLATQTAQVKASRLTASQKATLAASMAKDRAVLARWSAALNKAYTWGAVCDVDDNLGYFYPAVYPRVLAELLWVNQRGVAVRALDAQIEPLVNDLQDREYVNADTDYTSAQDPLFKALEWNNGAIGEVGQVQGNLLALRAVDQDFQWQFTFDSMGYWHAELNSRFTYVSGQLAKAKAALALLPKA